MLAKTSLDNPSVGIHMSTISASHKFHSAHVAVGSIAPAVSKGFHVHKENGRLSSFVHIVLWQEMTISHANIQSQWSIIRSTGTIWQVNLQLNCWTLHLLHLNYILTSLC